MQNLSLSLSAREAADKSLAAEHRPADDALASGTTVGTSTLDNNDSLDFNAGSGEKQSVQTMNILEL